MLGGEREEREPGVTRGCRWREAIFKMANTEELSGRGPVLREM